MTSFQVLRRLGSREQAHGLMRFEPARDLNAVVGLLRLGFGDELDDQERLWLEDLQAMASVGPLLSLLRWVPPIGGSFGGFVWYERGRLVANASLMRGPHGVAVIANVVTHPDYRRQGIALTLTQACIESARTRSARRVELQVRSSNQAARRLYEQLGFRYLYGNTTYRIDSAAASRRLEQAAIGFEVVASDFSDNREARRLLSRVGRSRSEPLPGPVAESLQPRSLTDAIEDRLTGRSRFGWAAVDAGAYRGLIAICTKSGGAHRLEIVTEPHWRGRVEAPLVNAAMVELSRRGRAAEARIRSEESGATDALVSAGFGFLRTLDRYALELV